MQLIKTDMAYASDKVSEKLKDRTVSLAPLLKILECAVCLEVVKIPFTQCKRGHLICYVCADSLACCPSCKATFSLEGWVCMQALIESLPRPCQHVGAGCEDIVEPNCDHQSYCKYRSVVCKYRLCQKEVTLNQLKNHFEATHVGSPVHSANKGDIKLSPFSLKSNYSVLIHVMDHFFWLRFICSLAEGSVQLIWHAHFLGKPRENSYYIELTFKDNNIGFNITLKALDLSRAGGVGGGCSTKVFFSSIKHCITTEGNLMFSYQVFTNPKTTS